MKIEFPAMQAAIGQRTYYATVMKLSEIATMFSFIADWIEFTPEEREQRVLNEKRIPDITRYIVENEDGYLFSSITASERTSLTRLVAKLTLRMIRKPRTKASISFQRTAGHVKTYRVKILGR